MDYKLWDIEFIEANKDTFVEQCHMFHKAIQESVDDEDTTRAYRKYNIFQVAGGSYGFYILYKTVIQNIREYVGDDRPLWMSGWLNFHDPSEVLDWHSHYGSLCHGYLSIDPKNTTTKFEGYDIENKVGRMYLGPSYREHKVVVNEPYEGYRITLGFDVSDGTDEDGDGHLLINTKETSGHEYQYCLPVP